MRAGRCRQSVCPRSAVFPSAPPEILTELSAVSVCTSVCLLSGHQPIEALAHVSVCLPTCSSAPRPFSPCVSGFSSPEISRRAGSPGPSVTPALSVLLLSVVCCWSVQFWFVPWGPHATNPLPKKNKKERLSLLVHYKAKTLN